MGRDGSVTRSLGRSTRVPRPMMTARAVPQVSELLEENKDKEWDDKSYVDMIREEYDHVVKTSGMICHPDLHKSCQRRPKGEMFCDWRTYVSCCIENLKWRMEDIEKASAAGIVWHQQRIGSEEVKKIGYVCKMAIRALEKHLSAGAIISK